MTASQLRCILVAAVFSLTALLLGGFGAILDNPCALAGALPCMAVAICASLFTFTY